MTKYSPLAEVVVRTDAGLRGQGGEASRPQHAAFIPGGGGGGERGLAQHQARIQAGEYCALGLIIDKK